MNKIFIMGRLTEKPELRTTSSGISVCRFNVAVPRPWRKDAEQETDFFTVQAWRGTAEFVGKYFSKGSKILVTGTLRNNNFVGKDGIKRYENIIIAESIEFTADKANVSEMRDTSDNGITLEDYEEIIDTPF